MGCVHRRTGGRADRIPTCTCQVSSSGGFCNLLYGLPPPPRAHWVSKVKGCCSILVPPGGRRLLGVGEAFPGHRAVRIALSVCLSCSLSEPFRLGGSWNAWRRRLGVSMLWQSFGLSGLDWRYFLQHSHLSTWSQWSVAHLTNTSYTSRCVGSLEGMVFITLFNFVMDLAEKVVSWNCLTYSNLEALWVFCPIRNLSFQKTDKSQIKGTLLQLLTLKTDLPWQRSCLERLQGCIFLLWPLLVRKGSTVGVSDSPCCSQ